MTYPATLPTALGALENEGPDPLGSVGLESMADVEYCAWIGQDDMLTVAQLSAFALRIQRRDASRPWSACIWPRHMDGTRHVCDGWCERGYRTAEDAARALEKEYIRRYGAA